ncbi:MAG: ATP-grasp domain-containing protein [Proteobacteria bacterium]|nr:ATP-grasp domain-containing protein [Pseudomonadota bacterium]
MKMHFPPKQNILILSQNQKFSINVIKCLRYSAHNYFLAGIEHNHKKIKKSIIFKKFIPTVSDFTELSGEDNKVVLQLLSVIDEENIDIVTPSDFESLKFLSVYKSVLEKTTTVIPLPDIKLIGHLDNKASCIKFLENTNVILPKTIIMGDHNNFDFQLLKTIGFPLIAKSALGAGGVGITKIKNQGELDKYLDKCKQDKLKEEIIIQEYIEGIDYCFYGYAINGMVKAWTLFRYVEFDQNQSKGLFAEFTNDEKVIETCREIISYCNYTGPITIDFRKELKTGLSYFIEINPRFGYNSSFSIIDGINFFEVGFELSVNENFETKPGCNALWSCSLKRLFSAPIRKFDLKSIYYIFWVGLPQVIFLLKQNRVLIKKIKS